MRGSTLIVCGLLAGCQAPRTGTPDAGHLVDAQLELDAAPDDASPTDAGTDGGFTCYDWTGEYRGATVRDVHTCEGEFALNESYDTLLSIGGTACKPAITMGGCAVPLVRASDVAADIQPGYQCNGTTYHGGTAYMLDGRLTIVARVRREASGGACEEVVINFDGRRR